MVGGKPYKQFLQDIFFKSKFLLICNGLMNVLLIKKNLLTNHVQADSWPKFGPSQCSVQVWYLKLQFLIIFSLLLLTKRRKLSAPQGEIVEFALESFTTCERLQYTAHQKICRTKQKVLLKIHLKSGWRFNSPAHRRGCRWFSCPVLKF